MSRTVKIMRPGLKKRSGEECKVGEIVNELHLVMNAANVTARISDGWLELAIAEQKLEATVQAELPVESAVEPPKMPAPTIEEQIELADNWFKTAKKAELVEACESRGISTDGPKAVLADRLREWVKSQAE